MRIRKNDIVKILQGKDRGKKGKVLKVFPSLAKVIVEGINYTTHFLRPNQENPKGGIARYESPMRVANVQLICPKCSKPTRIGYQCMADNTKERICKRCQEIL